jgi:hypothetical protein
MRTWHETSVFTIPLQPIVAVGVVDMAFEIGAVLCLIAALRLGEHLLRADLALLVPLHGSKFTFIPRAQSIFRTPREHKETTVKKY